MEDYLCELLRKHLNVTTDSQRTFLESESNEKLHRGI